MNRNWRYSRMVAEGSHTRDFDDSSYERIVIPHTNLKLPWHSFDEKNLRVSFPVTAGASNFPPPPAANTSSWILRA